MIDLVRRAAYCKAISQFTNNALTSDDFDEIANDLAQNTEDLGIQAVYRMLWQTYSEGSHFVREDGGLDEETKLLFERCLLFLGSEQEYRWPKSFCQKLCFEFKK